MPIIVSLQGEIAVGKTNVARYIEKLLPTIHVSYENPNPIVEIIKERKLDKNKFQDFIEIQRMFINAEIDRWKSFSEFDFVITDYGAEEIEYHTLVYPKIMGHDWDIETELKEELESLRKCRIDRIFFLDAGEKQLQKNKDYDSTRNRGYFDFYIKNFLNGKKELLSKRYSVEVIDCDELSILQQNEMIFDAIRSFYISCQDTGKFDVVEPYNTQWKKDFEAVKEIIYPQVKNYISSFEHVGSTSIEGMIAKPVIDIDIVLQENSGFPSVMNELEKLGYVHVGDQGIKDREVFKLIRAENKILSKITHHLYVCPRSSEELRRHLNFRKRLSISDDLRNEYIKIKLEILGKVGYSNRKDYVNTKQDCYSDFFRKVDNIDKTE